MPEQGLITQGPWTIKASKAGTKQAQPLSSWRQAAECSRKKRQGEWRCVAGDPVQSGKVSQASGSGMMGTRREGAESSLEKSRQASQRRHLIQLQRREEGVPGGENNMSKNSEAEKCLEALGK